MLNPYTYLCQRLISCLMAWISAYFSGSIYSDWIVVTFCALQVALKWPSSLDKILDFSRWNSSQRSIHHNWIFKPSAFFLKQDSILVHSSYYIPDLISYLPVSSGVAARPPYLLTLQGSALDVIDEQSRIKARNRYYWIAGLDGSDSMIFGRVFYTVDVYGTRIVYFSHWINFSSNRLSYLLVKAVLCNDAFNSWMVLLQVRYCWVQISHRSCLTFLSFLVRCLQLFSYAYTIFLAVRCFRIIFGEPSVYPPMLPTTVDCFSSAAHWFLLTFIPAIHFMLAFFIFTFMRRNIIIAASSSDSSG
ncbi:unnamed protein product [Rhizophagus irregularis]|nr:unnamed protein product [Rhizophagus irregularis]